MQTFKTLEFKESGKLAVLKLDRPDKRNAINKEMILELTHFFKEMKKNQEIVLLQIIGKGDAFCAGADISWLNSLENSSKDIIREEFLLLAHMLSAMYDLPQIVLTMAHGSVFGGGLGILACSDFVISAPKTIFSFSEINLGLVPATISPYVFERIGEAHARKLFFTGEIFDENKAVEINLVDQVPKANPGDLHYETLMETLLKKPHHALLSMKKLIRRNRSGESFEPIQEENCSRIAELISSPETQTLFKQFLRKG
jgi:methylglutaconyl-CoA hydratase